MGGGLSQEAILRPGQSFSKVIPLNRWALVKEPGQYIVVGTYPEGQYSINSNAVTSAPINIAVLPRTPEEMDAYLRDLTNQLAWRPTNRTTGAAPTSDREVKRALVMRLMYTCSPKVAPVLLSNMYEPDGDGFWVMEALLFYVPHSKEIRSTILQAVREHGLSQIMRYLLAQYGFPQEEISPVIERALAPDSPGNWAAGADLAGSYFDDAFTARLIAIAKDPASDARPNAITTLGRHRTDEGIAVLKSLLNDPDPRIWTPLAEAVEYARFQAEKASGTPLRPDDFDAEELKPLIERLLSSDKEVPDVITGASLVAQFGVDGFMQQMIAMTAIHASAVWPRAVYALAMNRTDEGVKTLKALLEDPYPKTRHTVELYLRRAYTDRGNALGRPLRPEDFDEKYQIQK